jgi:hypothetical protein
MNILLNCGIFISIYAFELNAANLLFSLTYVILVVFQTFKSDIAHKQE